MTPEIVEARYRAAEADARAAGDDYRAALNTRSKALLDKLMKKSPEDRLQALEDSGNKLLRAHRRILMRSLWKVEPARREIIVTTASWYEIWRSRLPYQIFPLSLFGLSVAAGILLAATAYRHTPLRWVTLDTTEKFSVKLRGPDGTISDRTISPGERLALIRIEPDAAPNGDIGVVRYWLKAEGYGEIKLFMKDLK